MNTTLLSTLTFATALVASQAHAQETKYKADHRFAYGDVVVENEQVKVEIKDALADIASSKFRFKVTNKTSDYLFVDPSKFKVSVGSGAAGFKEKAFMIAPHEDAARTLNALGATDYHHETYKLDFANGFELASAKGRSVEVEPATLPASKNEVKGGPFTVNMRKLVQETKRTDAKFTVKYEGSALAIIDPSKISVKIPAGQVFANAESKSKPVVITSGGEEGFTVAAEIPGKVADMQFTTLTVLWNDAFVETEKKGLPVDGASFAMDLAKTAAANK